jgi:outer membrane protein assembly factor BamB
MTRFGFRIENAILLTAGLLSMALAPVLASPPRELLACLRSLAQESNNPKVVAGLRVLIDQDHLGWLFWEPSPYTEPQLKLALENLAKYQYIEKLRNKVNTYRSLTGFKSRWEFPLSGTASVAPVTDGTKVYVATSGVADSHAVSQLQAIDALQGKELWCFKTPCEGFQSLAVSEGMVLTGGADGRLRAIDASTGKLVWDFATKDRIHSKPAVAAGVVYVGSHDRHLYAVELKTGKTLWSYRAYGLIPSSPVIASGQLYFGSWNSKDENPSTLYALDLNPTGLKGLLSRTRWSVQPEWYAGNDVAIWQDNAIVINRLGSVFAYDRQTGKPRWKYTREEGNFNALHYPSPVVLRDNVYCVQPYGTVFAVQAGTGRQVWERRFSDGMWEPLQIAKEVLTVASNEGKVYALDTEDGTVLGEAMCGYYRDTKFCVSNDATFVAGRNVLCAMTPPQKN